MTTFNSFKERTEYFIDSINKGEYNPSIYKTIAELGSENLFYVSQDYHGRYEDDDCTFYYWDNVNGEMVSDSWTTRCYCPNFGLYTHNILSFKEAMEQGLVNMNLLYKYNMERMRRTAKYNIDTVSEINPKHHPLVKVNRGRKWKGTGFLISIEDKTYTFGPTYGKGYNQTCTTTARILSIEDFQIHYVNYSYVEYVDFENILKEFENKVNSHLDEIVEKNKFNLAFETPTNHPVVNLKDMDFVDFDKFIDGRYPNIDSLIENAYDPVEEERKRKFSEQKMDKFTQLMDWVENNTDKTTELEKVKLSVHIMNKKPRY